MNTYFAHFHTPLGTMLLRAHHRALTGLYFTDQPDCPAGARVPAASPPRPMDGELGGRPIRGLRARRQGSAHDAQTDLFEASPAPKAASDNEAAHCSALVLADAHTPAGARAVFALAHTELLAYFAGELRTFSVPLAFEGTAFQLRVWRALQGIPYGEYVSYGDVALAAGMSRQHGRPVGMAVGQNPISIIVPCHRVLAGSGRLNGYTGGLDRKVGLLQIEGFEVY
ncbi:methylated-DNA--[protein]-cysteine S-methyltransferase [Pusillimonas sp. TS35]|uniref:methylated-DNA--[protein]-cysteine S-methyltransferase n=1 Tax=Paracandidimonas lactea TaxID=2895524 RepID=UPI00136F1DF3|nr:methylated-DNA--[protein]-cysteine S-methyltransferase [Paracandidimonas lactea]MYN12181.1 methylated-DNA--[protein]-cysteine S-methyltransferase [Pusillimonas sp. TS35]